MVFFSACNSNSKQSTQNVQSKQVQVRVLPLEGGFNFRDMGGYKTASGQSVKWGKVFRSDEMHNLTPSDLDYLNNIPLLTIVDFRSEKEIEDTPDKIPASVKNRYELTISPGNHSNIKSISDLTGEYGEEFMKEINRSFVTDTLIINRYKTFFALLQDENQIPLLFHCTAGKDRTGMGAALFLASLGVDENTIFEDYLLSNKYLEEKYKAITDSIPSMKPLLEVRPEYLHAGFEQIKKDYGNVENYLQQVLDVDLDLMKRLYLE